MGRWEEVGEDDFTAVQGEDSVPSGNRGPGINRTIGAQQYNAVICQGTDHKDLGRKASDIHRCETGHGHDLGVDEDLRFIQIRDLRRRLFDPVLAEVDP